MSGKNSVRIVIYKDNSQSRIDAYTDTSFWQSQSSLIAVSGD